jgi:hypothetical protein
MERTFFFKKKKGEGKLIKVKKGENNNYNNVT